MHDHHHGPQSPRFRDQFVNLRGRRMGDFRAGNDKRILKPVQFFGNLHDASHYSRQIGTIHMVGKSDSTVPDMVRPANQFGRHENAVT